MKNFTTNKKTLIKKGVYKNAGVTKIYKIPHKLNLERIVQFWFNSIDTNKVFTY